MYNRDVNDILKSLENEQNNSEGFNRKYFGSNNNNNNNKNSFDDEDDWDKKENNNENYKENKNSYIDQEEAFKKNPKVDADIDDDWGDDKNDDFFKTNTVFKNNDDDNKNNDYNYIDIHKISGIKENINLKYCDLPKLGNGFDSSVFLCNNLICTKCDCKVSIFENKMWDVGVNYLFFRNNYNRPEKLKSKLVDSYGTTCYSCQCTWNNISEENILAQKVSNWACAGHKNF